MRILASSPQEGSCLYLCVRDAFSKQRQWPFRNLPYQGSKAHRIAIFDLGAASLARPGDILESGCSPYTSRGCPLP